jgi:hypothetical protein
LPDETEIPLTSLVHAPAFAVDDSTSSQEEEEVDRSDIEEDIIPSEMLKR